MKKTRLTREETQQRIVATANALFRQFGYGKTSVADIAAELKMSTANIYKFFPSKKAIIEAGANSNICELEREMELIRHGKGSPMERIEKIILFVYHYHKKKFSREKQLFKLVVAAFEENWECIRCFQKFFLEIMTELVEEGVASGDFPHGDAAVTSRILLDSLQWITHPLLFPELDHKKVESRLRAQIRFFEGALR